MGISSSLYIGTTGIMAQQKNMAVISDNIANVNTVGFKSSHMIFNTLMSKQMGSASVGNQVGQGVGVSSILYDMSLGSLEPTNTATDISISGRGFFIVSADGSSDQRYTRAGNFRFDAEGYLRDPQGNILQGYRMPAESILDTAPVIPPATGAPITDIRLDMQDGGGPVSEPEATTEMRMMINLDSSSLERSASSTSPFTALFDSWDATQLEPLDSGAYSYESAMKVFDSDGNAHVVRAFFDPVEDGTSVANGNRMWEFLVTVPPAEDASGLDTKKGVLMAGTLTFTASGELLNMSAFEGSSDDKSSWVPVGLSEDGYPVLNASLVGAEPISSAFDMGLRSNSGWNLPAGVSTMADLGTAASDVPSLLNADRQILATTNFNSGSSTLYQSQNGYERGFLQSVSVDTEGVLVGYFSNGQNQSLYKIPMADFINPQGLFREGGNLFSATKDSGAVSLGWAGEGRLGSVITSSLESSNVDLGTEFVNMIITQKGFDANSKVITTGDQVVQTAIQMKR
ncbi:flagellar hook protein FlgE [Desulfomicrobium macestii]|uniref:Flagellar hook protein FlgE n=1 Tax=Desulfomicrobium macestii TaxID=90731 RepID=A0ABR9H5D0_9BACT|nr:flagellar hook protein FlgE [Desulfomicrobium macestii]MBE1425921.1 flagellar hook protein FlgE [Desulfomicrobium macestii]